MIFLIFSFLIIFSVIPLQAQSKLAEFNTSSCVFNDTLWFINADGFQFVALGDDEIYEPEPVMRHDIRDSYTVFRSESYLWLIGFRILLRYDGKRVSSYEFPSDSIKSIERYFAISDDSLFFSMTYKKPLYKLDATVPVLVKEVVFKKGAFFHSPTKYKKQQHTARNGDVYSAYPYYIDYQSKNGKSKKIELRNSKHRIEKTWLSPEDELWVYQQKIGFTLINKTKRKEIPFSFKDKMNRVSQLLFMENGEVVVFSSKSYAIFTNETWLEFPMLYCTCIEQSKNTLFFIRQDDFSIQSIN